MKRLSNFGRFLVDNLVQIDTIRFLQQMEWEHSYYTRKRQYLLKGVTREEFLQDLQRIRNLEK